MTDWVNHQIELKLGLLLLGLAVLGFWQWHRPARGDGSWLRWRRNLSLIALSTVATRLVVPVSGVAAAAWAEREGLGVFNAWPVSEGVAFFACLVALDFAIYWQHRAFHAVPWLWRTHRVHHSDPGFDLSLGLRFHPLEIVPSAVFKLGVVIALGATAEVVVVYELILLGMSMFTHTDARLPPRVERVLRWVLVTPDWHRVHHAVDRSEHDRNFGNGLSVWDRLFRTALEQPAGGHVGMVIGLEGFSRPEYQTLGQLVRQPFSSRPLPAPKAEAPDA